MRNRFLVFLVALFGFQLGCSMKTPPRSGKHTLRTCLFMDPATLDPRKNGDVYSSTLNFLLYEGLTRILPDGTVALALAESVDISEDGKTYIFHLKDSVWNDGHPVTAEDFEYSWKRVLDPRFASPCPHLFFPIKNAEAAACNKGSIDQVAVQALDAKTLKVELENPTPYFLSLISFCNFAPIPKHIEQVNPFWHNINHTRLVSNGAYELVDWTHNRDIRVKKSETYWDKENVHLEEIELNIISEAKAALNLFENGEIDVLTTLTMPFNSEDLSYWQQKGQLLKAPMPGTAICTFNLDRSPFNNLNIRKALSMSIDRKAVVSSIAPFANQPAAQCLPPSLIHQTQENSAPIYNAQAAKAHLKKGLQELGIDLRQFEKACILSLNTSDEQKKIAQIIQQQWKEVLGIHATLQTLDAKSLQDRLHTRNYSLALSYYIAQYNDANNILERFKYKQTQKNLPGFENAQYAALLDEAKNTLDTKKRIKLLVQAADIISEQTPFTPLYHFSQSALIHPSFTQVEFSPLGNLLYRNLKFQENP